MPKSSGASNRAKREESQRTRAAETHQVDLRLSNLPDEEAAAVRLMLNLRAAGIIPDTAPKDGCDKPSRATKARATKAPSKKKSKRETKPRG